MVSTYLVEPIDTLMIRGNRSFGEGGEYGQAVMPPWPSVFSGAFRSAILAREKVDIASFLSGKLQGTEIDQVLGNPLHKTWGTMRISRINFVRADINGSLELLYQMPYDLEVASSSTQKSETSFLKWRSPQELQGLNLLSSASLSGVALIRGPKTGKARKGFLLGQAGFDKWRVGRLPENSDLIPMSSLFKSEVRLGIGINTKRRTAESGLLYTTDAVTLADGVAFCVEVAGDGELLGESGLLRLGGDGRAATYRKIAVRTIPSLSGNSEMRIMVSSPAIFPGGWMLPGSKEVIDAGRPKTIFDLPGGFSAEIFAVALARPAVISGWSMVQNKPKPAQRSVTPGSIYFLRYCTGDFSVLEDWVADGMWGGELGASDEQRRSEGFNSGYLASGFL